jgi:hypothetical protein
LGLAVVLIALLAVVLAWATYIESVHGTPAVHFGIYTAWWFVALHVLLGLNVFCAAAIRFPWKRRQTGFLIVHGGILVLLLGCLLTRLGGVDAQLAVFEGATSWRAYADGRHFELAVHAPNLPEVREITIPFAPGPFNWDDYPALARFPWHLAHRDRGVIHDRDGITLEVLDYYSDSVGVPVPRVTLRIGGSRRVTLDVRSLRNPHDPRRRVHVGSRKEFAHGEWITFRAARSKAETEAFRASRPEGPFGALGRLVLHARGRKFSIALDELQTKSKMPLGDTGLKVELVRFEPRVLGVHLRIHRDDGTKTPPRPMILSAVRADLDRQDEHNGVFGSYWFDATQTRDPKDDRQDPVSIPDEAIRKARRRRIDVIQGNDQKLYYRAWNPPRVEEIGELPTDGSAAVVFEKTNRPVPIRVEEFIPRKEPGVVIRPVPFDKDERTVKQPRARVRLSVDGTAEEFWLASVTASPEDRRRTVRGNGRRVTIRMRRDRVELGFGVHLHKFQRELDPGTDTASHYSSLVDFIDRRDHSKRLKENVLITLNAPVEMADPVTGRSYRLFQSAFEGPWRPGDAEFDQLVGGSAKRDQLFRSILTVSHDPGRSLKYAGCVLIVAGMVVMYFMKAYFFRRL